MTEDVSLAMNARPPEGAVVSGGEQRRRTPQPVRVLGSFRSRVSRIVRTHSAVVVAVVCLAYVLIHLAMIVRSRQVWFDETFFASIADSLTRTGELELPISPLWLSAHVYLYGPLYFVIVATFFELFGIGIVQNRLPGLLFGFAVLGMTFLILRQQKVTRGIALMTSALLALDPTFHQSIHSGRTDSTSLFFILCSLFFLLKSRDAVGTSGVVSCVGSGILAALGVLATPRPGYMLIPMGFILLTRWYRCRTRDVTLQLLAWGMAFGSLYGIWVFYAFGSITGMFDYYSAFTDTYTGGSQIRLVHLPLLMTLCALLVVLLLHRPRRAFGELTVFALWSVVGFYVFVKSAASFGALYATLMVPAAYLALGKFMAECSELQIDRRRKRFIGYGAFGLLLLVNGSAFLARSVLEFVEWERRDPSAAEKVIHAVVPSGSSVIGDDQFYFAVRRNGSEFQYSTRGATLEKRVAYHRDVFQFDYLITSRSDDSEVLRAYMEAVPLRQVAEIEVPPTTELAELIVGIGQWLGLSDSLKSGYGGRIFARSG